MNDNKLAPGLQRRLRAYFHSSAKLMFDSNGQELLLLLSMLSAWL